MSMRTLTRTAFATNLLALAAAAPAAYLVNTGQGTGGDYALFNYTPNDAQSLGASFHVASASVVHSIEAYMSGGFGDVVIELIDGTSPTGTALYSTTMNVSTSLESWNGAFALGWVLAAGDYTVTFSDPGSYDGAIRGGASNGLANEWFTYNSLTNWFVDNLALSLRIDADPLAVSEPAMPALLLAGLALAGLGRRLGIGKERLRPQPRA